MAQHMLHKSLERKSYQDAGENILFGLWQAKSMGVFLTFNQLDGRRTALSLTSSNFKLTLKKVDKQQARTLRKGSVWESSS